MNRPFIACNHGVQYTLHAGSGFGEPYCTQQTGGLTRGMTLRAIQTAEAIVTEPDWMAAFLASLTRDDLAPATLRGYRYDLRHFLAGHWRARGGRRAGCPANAHGAQPTARRSDRYRSSCVVARGWRLLAWPCRQKLRAGSTHAAGGTTCRRGRDIAYRRYYRERPFRYCAHPPRQRSQGARDTLERDGAAGTQAISGRTPGVGPGQGCGTVRQQPRYRAARANNPGRYHQPRQACPPEAGGGFRTRAASHLRAWL